MMKTQQDKMSLIFLIMDVLQRLNVEIGEVFSDTSIGVFDFSFINLVKKLSAK